MPHGCFVPRALATCLLGLAAAGVAHAQAPAKSAYPTKPIRLLLGFAPGGGSDTLSRLIGQKLTDRLGQSIIIDNRPGGNGVIAMNLATTAQPDGYTVMLLSNSSAVSATWVTRVPYDLTKVFDPITMLVEQPYVLCVSGTLPVKSVDELIAYAKSRNGALNYGSAGQGSSAHFGMELVKHMAKVDITHIPYKGIGPAFLDLASGRIQMLFASAVSAGNAVRTGKIRAIAVGSPQRSRGLPELPTISESGLPGFELTGWYSLVGPAGMPRHVVTLLNKEVGEVLNLPDMKERLANDGSEAAPGTPEALRKRLASELARWGRLIKQANLQL
jgi:tripartite-type tricarboxylate transporter receptor subunit TctC